MAWKDDERNYRPGPGATREPAVGERGGAGHPAVGGGETVRSVGRDRGTPSGYTRGEETVITDGQLGAQNLDRGPERANPEGSVDISNVDFRRTEMAASAHRTRLAAPPARTSAMRFVPYGGGRKKGERRGR